MLAQMEGELNAPDRGGGWWECEAAAGLLLCMRVSVREENLFGGQS